MYAKLARKGCVLEVLADVFEQGFALLFCGSNGDDVEVEELCCVQSLPAQNELCSALLPFVAV